jgi:glycosyltransferase involved in cell wall biosynthesis
LESSYEILPHFSVILCCKNSEDTIERCVSSLIDAGVSNLIVIDGWSTDQTQSILRKLRIDFLLGEKKGLSKDCQIGIDSCKTEFAFFVDSDHIVPLNFFKDMFYSFLNEKCDFLQSKLRIYEPSSRLNQGEDAYYKMIHNNHYDKKMIGTSPALFRVNDLRTGGRWQFYSDSANAIGDTSWATRSYKLGATFKVGGPNVFQIHDSSRKAYFEKFKWYGRGDGDFIIEFPERKSKMLFHLAIRYPFIFGFKMLLSRNMNGFLFVVMQGFVRLYFCLTTLFSRKSKVKIKEI